MATIKDVAQAAGVSVATVSRALNQPDSVREETRQQVMAAVQALHYSPNDLGKNLRQRRTGRILVVLTSISNQFYSRVLRGIEDAARDEDYHVLISTTRDTRSNLLEALSLLRSRVVDGAILMTTRGAEAEISSLNRHSPIVCACEPPADPDIPCVAIDNVRASYDATRYLLENGKCRIALLGIRPELLDSSLHGRHSGSAILRETGYRRALEEAGLQEDPALVFPAGLTYKAGARCVEELIRLPQLPDAVFALSDTSAIGAIQALIQHGIRVPEDISVVGFDNTAMSEVYLPAITTIGQPQYEIGQTALRLLLERVDGKPARSVTVPHRLIVRDSVSHGTALQEMGNHSR